jgi:hypothetical protein
MKYRVEGRTVKARRPLDQGRYLIFRADELRRERTGIHGRITISLDTTLLAYSTFNVGRSGERKTLANDAHNLLTVGGVVAKDDGEPYSRDHLRHELDLFCIQVWPQMLDAIQPEMVEGDNMSHAIEFLAHPHVISGGGTIMFGPPEATKSTTAIINAIAVDEGLNGIWDTKQRNTLFVNLERSSESIQRRIGASNAALGLDPHRPLRVLNARGRSLGDVYDSIQRYVDTENIEFLVLDSLSRAGMGDLIDNKDVNNTADRLNLLCPTWLSIAHTPRADTSHVYGSVFWEAAADIMLQAIATEKDDGVVVALKVTKANDMRKPPIKCLAYQFDEYGLKTVAVTSIAAHPELLEDIKLNLEQEVMAYLLSADMGKASVNDIADALDKKARTIQRMLKGNKKFLEVGKDQKTPLYGVADSNLL